MSMLSLFAILGLTQFVSTSTLLQGARDLLSKVPVVGAVLTCWMTVCLVSSVLVYSVSHLLGGLGDMLVLALASMSALQLFNQLTGGVVSFLNRKSS